MKSRTRVLALGGVVGPVAFVVSWAVAGATTPGYSSVDDAISDLAAVGASTRVAMTSAFVVFGLGLIAFGLALRETLDGPAWIAAVVTGVCTLGVAATPLDGWSGDEVHARVRRSRLHGDRRRSRRSPAPSSLRSGRRHWARVSVLMAGVSAACLVASSFGEDHGFWQRLGLGVADAWIVVTAAYHRQHGPVRPRV